MSKGRLEAFSDGVFAIVITLLILDVRLPAGSGVSLEALELLWPKVAAFVLSFVVVGVYWVAHHSMMHFIESVDRNALWLNLLLLLCVVFIPFPASFLGLDPKSPLSIRLYGLTLIATNAAGTAFWLYSTLYAKLASPGVTKPFARRIALLHASPILLYCVGIALAGSAQWVSLGLYAAVPLFFILPNPMLARLAQSDVSA